MCCCILFSCQQQQKGDKDQGAAQFGITVDPEEGSQARTQLADYWYQGKAEISSYQLEQARYGEIHAGNAVLIFVTEDFNIDKQVKKESPSRDETTGVLKLNTIRKFPTGLYDYSIMSSIFMPVDTEKYPHVPKMNTSSQDWCGQSFVQLNLQSDGNYRVLNHSYFEKEGEQDFEIKATILEDEIPLRLRLDPKKLPIGAFNIIPSTVHTTLRHEPIEVRKATAAMGDYKGTSFVANQGNQLKTYTITFGSGRILTYVFEEQTPHVIVGWEEQYNNLTTRATRIKTMMSPYWSKNGVGDVKLRKELGL